jgi:hypothetical protein
MFCGPCYHRTASIILLNHLQKPEIAKTFVGKRILELGSGLGHLGMGLYSLGAHVTCTERPQEFDRLTASLAKQKDSPQPVLESALALLSSAPGSEQGGGKPAVNSTQTAPATAQGSIQAVALEWGQEGYAR